MELDIANAMQVVRACIILNNFLLTRRDKNYAPPGCRDTEDDFGNVTPGNWRHEIDVDVCDLRSDSTTRPSTAQAREVKDDLKDYFFEEGALDFQWKMIE